MNHLLTPFLIGAVMGAANVIPGVSGGTVAFITGIYERLIAALKSFDLTALRLLLRRQWTAFLIHIDALFLTCLMAGVLVSFLSIAKVIEWALVSYERMVFAFFFGLIFASVFVMARMVWRWSPTVVFMFMAGTAAALSLAFLTPAAENNAVYYLFLCGVAAMCSMIIPGLSGAFVLVLMGNYELVLRAVNERDIFTLIPIAIGAVTGLLCLSRILSWLFRRFHDHAVGLISGFVAGSLLIIWPWKVVAKSIELDIGGKSREKIIAYRWEWPDASLGTLAAVALIITGMAIVWISEWILINRRKLARVVN